MKDLLIQTIEPLGYPIRLQGSLNPNEQYPDTMFTFWNRATYDQAFYDNNETVTVWEFDLNVYSIDADLVNTLLTQAKALLKAQGFIVSGKGHDIASDVEYQTGRGISVLKIEKLGE